MSDLKKENEKIAEGVTSGFQKIEDGVVGGYKKIESAVVGAYKGVEDKFVGRFLTRQGETIEEAKVRLAQEQSAQEETGREIAESATTGSISRISVEASRAMGRASVEASKRAGRH